MKKRAGASPRPARFTYRDAYFIDATEVFTALS